MSPINFVATWKILRVTVRSAGLEIIHTEHQGEREGGVDLVRDKTGGNLDLKSRSVLKCKKPAIDIQSMQRREKTLPSKLLI